MSPTPFPKEFLWGASTAAYQVEGGLEYTDWAEGARYGEVPVCGAACDHYHRFAEDFDIAASLGMNAQRFSIEWARIEPDEGVFDEQEIAHYREVFAALKARGLTPVVNLWHFTLPLWFSRRGGFLSPNAPEVFARYCAYVIEQLGEHADVWLTINEPEIWAQHGYWTGNWPPFKKHSLIAYQRARRALVAAHKAAYSAMKKVRPEIKIGIAKHNIYFASDGSTLNNVMRAVADWYWDHWFLRAIEGYQDVIGLNHYLFRKFGKRTEKETQLPRSDMGWDLHPDSLYHCLRDLKRYGLPIIVSENGIADAADSRRERFLLNAFASLERALKDGVQLTGYLYWSLLDNYEWALGFTKRFGLVEVNYTTFARTVRASAHTYAALIKQARTL